MKIGVESRRAKGKNKFKKKKIKFKASNFHNAI